MAKQSVSAFQKLKKKFLRIKRVFDLILPLFPIAFLIYSIIAKKGFLWANVISLILAVAYYVFHVFVLFQSRENKDLTWTVKTIYKTCVRLIKFLTLAVSVYGLWVSISDFNFLSLILTVFSIIGWIMQVTLDFILYTINRTLTFAKETIVRSTQKHKPTESAPTPAKKQRTEDENPPPTPSAECKDTAK